jgi:hypothetical protein
VVDKVRGCDLHFQLTELNRLANAAGWIYTDDEWKVSPMY